MNRIRTHALPIARFHDALGSALDALPDGELLDRFAHYADHPAFETLLRRHGVMVYGVCRRILANADVDDAFQATFLILIRKASSIRGGPLGPWLYGVACRVAMKARSRAARFAEFRAEAVEMIPDPTKSAETPDWLPILDAELAALPAKYRDALVLCELQGISRAEAAKTLGVKEGTLSSRLARGRELLRKRLLKHGALLPVGGLVALLGANSLGRASVPAALLSKILEFAKEPTGAAVGSVPVGAARLTDEVLKSMFLTKLRIAGAAGLAVLLLAVGVTAAAWPGVSGGSPSEAQGTTKKGNPTPNVSGEIPPTPGAKPPERGVKDTAISDRDAIQGWWVLDKGEGTDELQNLIGKMQFFVTGDVWWMIFGYENEPVIPLAAKLEPTKNPKWLDLLSISEHTIDNFGQRIYELNGDKLRICVGGVKKRPAEFLIEDKNDVIILQFTRGPAMPPPVDKTLIGSWGEGTGKDGLARVEIYNDILFYYLPNEKKWLGGRYTVDTTKNPKWITVDLIGDSKQKTGDKIYGCYEVVDGKLKLAFGENGKRTERPLDFAQVEGVLSVELKATKEPLQRMERTKEALQRTK